MINKSALHIVTTLYELGIEVAGHLCIINVHKPNRRGKL